MAGEINLELKGNLADLAQLAGGLPISDGDVAGEQWLAEARHRYDHDAEFHYRVRAAHQALTAAFINGPVIGQVALALLVDEKVRKANGLR